MVRDEFCEEMYGALNAAASKSPNHVRALEETLSHQIAYLKKELAKVVVKLNETKEELVIC